MQPFDLIRAYSTLFQPARQLSNTSAVGQISHAVKTRALDSFSDRGNNFVRLSDPARLKSAFSDLRDSVGKLDSAEKASPFVSKVTGASATAKVTGSKPPAEVEIDVAQLAQAQQVRSASFNDASSVVVGTGKLQVEFGRVNAADGSFSGDGKIKSIDINSGDGTLAGIAKAINSSDSGLSARLVADGAKVKLQIESKDTGAAQAFRLSSNDNDGNNSDASGLSQLNFNPAAAAASQTTTQQQTARDAEFTVDGASRTAASNNVTESKLGISLSLQGAGRSTLQFQRDAEATQRSAEQLAGALNQFAETLAGGVNDGLARRAVQDVGGAIGKSSSGSGLSRLALADIGFKQSAQGRIEIDQKQLDKQLASNPSGVADLLADAADKLGQASDKALANGSTLSRSLQAQPSGGSLLAQRLLSQFDAGQGSQSSLLTYAPSGRSAQNLAQYLIVSQL